MSQLFWPDFHSIPCFITILLPSKNLESVSFSLPQSYSKILTVKACLLTWWSTNPFITVLEVISILVISTGISSIVFSYQQLVQAYFKMKKKKGQKPTEESAARDRKILIKCVSISATFVLCWTPLMLMIVISMITRTPIPPTLEALFTIFAGISSVANPILIIIFDASLKYDVYNMFGLARLLARKASSKQCKKSKPTKISKKSSATSGTRNSGNEPCEVGGKSLGIRGVFAIKEEQHNPQLPPKVDDAFVDTPTVKVDTRTVKM